LSPTSSFEAFVEDKLLRMVELYPNDFKGGAKNGGAPSASELC
jgi:hypothetical protein